MNFVCLLVCLFVCLFVCLVRMSNQSEAIVIDRIQIRHEQPDDYLNIFHCTQDAFKQRQEAQLINELRKNIQNFKANLSFVAIYDGQLIGHCLFTPIKIHFTLKEIDALALAPVSVLTKFQNMGVGTKLLNYALNEVKITMKNYYSSIIVLGHEFYYPRFGFLPAYQFKIRPQFPLKNKNCFLLLELMPFSNVNPLDEDGIVEYPSEFQSVC